MDLEKAKSSDRLLLEQVGRLTVAWAHLEFALDAMILLIHRTMDGSVHEKRLPRPLERKIEYLRSAFSRLGITATDAASYERFLTDIEAAAVTRHDIVHGFPVHHPSDSGEAKLVRLIIEKDSWAQRQVTIDIDSVTRAVSKTMQLAGKARDWTLLMFDYWETNVRPGLPQQNL